MPICKSVFFSKGKGVDVVFNNFCVFNKVTGLKYSPHSFISIFKNFCNLRTLILNSSVLLPTLRKLCFHPRLGLFVYLFLLCKKYLTDLHQTWSKDGAQTRDKILQTCKNCKNFSTFYHGRGMRSTRWHSSQSFVDKELL